MRNFSGIMHVKKERIKGGGIIGQILVIEFAETDSGVFDEVIGVLQKHKSFETVRFKGEKLSHFPDSPFIQIKEKCIVTGRKYL